MSTERQLPKSRRSRAAIVAVGFLVVSAVCVVWALRADSLAPLWLVAAALVSVLVDFYYRRRCPQCGRRMMFRAEPMHPETYRYRILFDCKHCDVVWDSGEVQAEDLG